MAFHKITKGLDIPISGEPEQEIAGILKTTQVAILAEDYPGMKPRMAVREGDSVKRGQLLFENRKEEGVRFTAPAAGTVIGIHRGARRALQSVVIRLNENEVRGIPEEADFQGFTWYAGRDPATLSRMEIVGLLVESGLWTAFRTRPFSKVPSPESTPDALFVTAIDTNPLAANPEVVVAQDRPLFDLGLELVTKITDGPTFLCVRPGSSIGANNPQVRREEFAGPHPAGTPGLHIHRLFPVSRQRKVWHVNYQDVISVAKLFMSGKLDVARVISIGGPVVRKPRLVKTRLGASLDDILGGEFNGKESFVRYVSGSVLNGRRAMGAAFGYLGRYHSQVTVLREGNQRELLGWLGPGLTTFSVLPLFASKLLGPKKFNFTTTTNGSPRAMVPLGMYERVMPLDILPTFLLRALSVGDVERAEQLGALELDEEDLALCTFVCPGKTNYGMILRKNLQTIEEEG